MPALLLLLFNITGIFTIAILLGRVFENKKIAAMSFFVAGSSVCDYSAAGPIRERRRGGKYHRRYADSGRAVFSLSCSCRKKTGFSPGCFFSSFVGLALYAPFERVCSYFFDCQRFCFYIYLLNIKNALQIIGDWLKIFLKPFPLAIIFLGALFFLFVFTPSYFNSAAVSQATGEPIQNYASRTLAFPDRFRRRQRPLVLGESVRFLLALLALKRKELKYSVALGWFLILVRDDL